MNRIVRVGASFLLYSSLTISLASAGDTILPQGNTRLQELDAAEQAGKEDVRKSRLKQQGQGENYRVEGELRGGSKGPKVDMPSGHDREKTGIEDPTVNPGQAAGLKTVRGRILKSEANTITIEQQNGDEIVLAIDPETKLNWNFHPGDRVTGTVTNQGRAVVLEKEGKPKD